MVIARTLTDNLWRRATDADRWPAYATAVLVLLLAHQAARLTWAVVTPPDAVQAGTGSASDVGVAASGPDLAALRAAELFGRLEADPNAAGDAPETRLSLDLRGVIASRDVRVARAFIASSGGAEQGYAIGATLPGGARLSAVHEDRVILERDGRFETLSLPRDAAPVLASRSAAVSDTEVRAVAEGNPQRLLDVVRPVAATDSNTGRMLGYRVYPGRDADRFARLGLMPGDLVVSVNGSSLDDPARGLEVLKGLTSSDSVMLNVERDGQQRLIQVPVSR
jgi:general secretion pathway protein C